MKLIISRTKRYGGITSFLFNYLDSVDLNDEDILILDSNIDYNLKNLIEEKYNCQIIFFPKIKKRNLVITRFLQSLFIKKIIKENRCIKDVIFIDWNLILDWYVHTTNKKIISFVHTYPTRKIPVYFKSLVKILIRNTNVITVSNYSANKIMNNWQIDNNRVKVLYNCSNLKGKVKTKVLTEEAVKIVTIAHCEPYKDPELWYEVASNVTKSNKSVSFHWYGDGSLFDKYREKTSDDNNIHFHGYSNRIEGILNEETTVYLQCSKVESLGISILDAMNYSVPVIVLNNGGMPELIKDNNSGYICSDKDNLIEKILELATNSSKYNMMSKNIKERYEMLFSKEIWLKNLKKILTT